MTDPRTFDMIIIGGGLVGGTLACALSQHNFKIALIEAFPFNSSQQPSYDDRSIALAYGSRTILESSDLWDSMREDAIPIHTIHVSDSGHFGCTRIKHQSTGYDALGYVIENRAIGRAFADRINRQDNIELFCPAQLKTLTTDDQQATITIQLRDNELTLTAPLVIGADGNQSTVRKLSNIQTRQWDYGQSAIITNITAEKAHNNIAFERFTRNGPLAVLPLSQGRCSVVWTVHDNDLDAVMSLSDTDFLSQLQQHFGYRLGRLLHCGSRNSYPLKLVRSTQHTAARVVLIGNAAHTLHPIAGQGFNLGIRDVAALAELIVDARHRGYDVGGTRVLSEYARWRDQDQRNVSVMTDGLVRIFSNNFTPIVLARNIGMLAIDVLPPLKKHLARQAMGLRGRLPRLTRGLPL